MRCGSIIIASNGGYVAETLRSLIVDTASHNAMIVDSEKVLVNMIQLHCPSLVLIEDCLNGIATEELVARLAKHHRGIKISVWTAARVQTEMAARFIFAGAESFFSLREEKNNIALAINKITNGHEYYPLDVMEYLDKTENEPVFGEKLTQREREIIKLSYTLKTAKKVGEALGLSEATVKLHRQKIYRKFGGDSEIDLIRIGLRFRVIIPDYFEEGGKEIADTK